jgi:fructose-bisphosphate aldolase class II
MEALKLGFSSVMFDASTKPYDENVAETREVVKIAHAFGATVEGEIGHVGQAATEDDKNGMYTTVEEAVDFQSRTGVDALAIAVGTAHGVYKAKPQLNLERLREIRAALPTPLVLHGGSGLSDDDFRNAIRDGVAKLNIHTDLCVAGMNAMHRMCAEIDPAKPATSDYLRTHLARVEAMKACVIEKMRLFGSVGKA